MSFAARPSSSTSRWCARTCRRAARRAARRGRLPGGVAGGGVGGRDRGRRAATGLGARWLEPFRSELEDLRCRRSRRAPGRARGSVPRSSRKRGSRPAPRHRAVAVPRVRPCAALTEVLRTPRQRRPEALARPTTRSGRGCAEEGRLVAGGRARTLHEAWLRDGRRSRRRAVGPGTDARPAPRGRRRGNVVDRGDLLARLHSAASKPHRAGRAWCRCTERAASARHASSPSSPHRWRASTSSHPGAATRSKLFPYGPWNLEMLRSRLNGWASTRARPTARHVGGRPGAAASPSSRSGPAVRRRRPGHERLAAVSRAIDHASWPRLAAPAAAADLVDDSTGRTARHSAAEPRTWRARRTSAARAHGRAAADTSSIRGTLPGLASARPRAAREGTAQYSYRMEDLRAGQARLVGDGMEPGDPGAIRRGRTATRSSVNSSSAHLQETGGGALEDLTVPQGVATSSAGVSGCPPRPAASCASPRHRARLHFDLLAEVATEVSRRRAARRRRRRRARAPC